MARAGPDKVRPSPSPRSPPQSGRTSKALAGEAGQRGSAAAGTTSGSAFADGLPWPSARVDTDDRMGHAISGRRGGRRVLWSTRLHSSIRGPGWRFRGLGVARCLGRGAGETRNRGVARDARRRSVTSAGQRGPPTGIEN